MIVNAMNADVKRPVSSRRVLRLWICVGASLAFLIIAAPWVYPLKLRLGGHGLRWIVIPINPAFGGNIPRRYANEGLEEDERQRSPRQNWALPLPGNTRAYVLNWW